MHVPSWRLSGWRKRFDPRPGKWEEIVQPRLVGWCSWRSDKAEGRLWERFCRERLVGLGVWFSLRVREVPGSNPGRAQVFFLHKRYNLRLFFPPYGSFKGRNETILVPWAQTLTKTTKKYFSRSKWSNEINSYNMWSFSSEGKIWICLYHFETHVLGKETRLVRTPGQPRNTPSVSGARKVGGPGWAGAQSASHGRGAGGRARAWADLGRTCRHQRCPANVLDSRTGRNGMSLFRASHCSNFLRFQVMSFNGIWT